MVKRFSTSVIFPKVNRIINLRNILKMRLTILIFIKIKKIKTVNLKQKKYMKRRDIDL